MAKGMQQMAQNKLQTWLLASTALAMGITSVPAYATDAPQDQPPQTQPSATPPAATTDGADDIDIVVTARRRNERLLDVPVAATVVSGEQISTYSITSVQNLKIIVPEVSFDRGFTGSGTSIVLRGVSSSVIDAGVEQAVLLDFDGVAISRGRVLSDAMFDVSSVDVLKGPQALFFGKNSPGGVVSIKSNDPTPELSGYVRSGYEFRTQGLQTEAAISGPLTDKLGIRIAGFASSSSGYIRNNALGMVDPYAPANPLYGYVPPQQGKLGAEKKIAGRVTLKYESGDFTANFKLLYSWFQGQGQNSMSEVMGCAAGQAVPTNRFGGINYPDATGDCSLNDRVSSGWMAPEVVRRWPIVNKYDGGRPYSRNATVMPVLTLNKTLGSIDLTSVTSYYDYKFVTQANSSATADAYYWNYANENNKSFYQEVRAVSKLDGPINFALGGHYENNVRTFFNGGLNGRPGADATTGRLYNYDNEQHNKSWAMSAFGQIMLKFDKLEIAGGGRFTYQHKTINSFNVFVNSNVTNFLPVGSAIKGKYNESNFSPEATISYHVNPNLMIYGAYKTGYLAGGFSNPGQLTPTTTAQTLTFTAETVTGFEAGIKGAALGNKLTGSITAFRYIYKGLPLTSLVALSSTQITYRTQNAANTIAQGVEFEGSFRPVRGTTFRVTASYNDAHFKKFTGAQCYAGQTAAQGCVTIGNSTTQDLSGKPVYRAPDWILTAGLVQDVPISSSMKMSFNADVRYNGGYFATLGLNPVSYQKAYTLLNGGVRLAEVNDKWSVSLIGRNLTNNRYATLGVDRPGGFGDVFAVAGEPRAVLVQLETRF